MLGESQVVTEWRTLIGVIYCYSSSSYFGFTQPNPDVRKYQGRAILKDLTSGVIVHAVTLCVAHSTNWQVLEATK